MVAQPVTTDSPKHSVFSRQIVLWVVLGFVLVAAVILSFTQRHFHSGAVRIGDSLEVRVEVAATEATQERGLSGKRGLDALEGMYFVFPHEDKYAFWMKDMLFPIDIIWIREGAIADITTDIPPPGPGQAQLPTYGPRVPVDRVLEVRAGFAREHGLKIGLPVTEMLGNGP